MNGNDKIALHETEMRSTNVLQLSITRTINMEIAHIFNIN